MPIKITNKHNLPETIVRAVKYNTHVDGGDISVSSLVDAPQPRILRRMHTIEEDVSERIAALLGTATHHILEMASMDNAAIRHFSEASAHITSKINESTDEDERVDLIRARKWLEDYMSIYLSSKESKYIFEQVMRVEVSGWVLSGIFDLYDKETDTLYDYKITSVNTYLDPEARKKYYAQLNVYAWMLRKQGLNIKKASVVMILKDWTSYGVLRNRDYPACAMVEINIPLYADSKMEVYVKERVELHQRAEKGDVIPCTAKEKWSSSDVYKIKQHGLKRSIKNFEVEAHAKEWVEKNKHIYTKPLMVEKTPGESKRCEMYCSVRHVCTQRAEEKELLKD
jgi:hypothetical protein